LFGILFFEPAQPIARLFAGRYEFATEVGNYFQKSLAAAARWIKFSAPNENWAQRRVSAIKSCVIAAPAVIN
jgi:hypothetical protein